MKIVLISTYELGRQPFGLASPAAWLGEAGFKVTCLDTSVQELSTESIRQADLLAFYLPMHTATRKAIRVLEQSRKLNAVAPLCFYGLYAPMNADYLTRLGADAIIGGEFEAELVRWARRWTEQIKPEEALEDRETDSKLPARVAVKRLAREENCISGNLTTATADRPSILISHARLKFLAPQRDGLPPLERYAHLAFPDGFKRLVGYTEASRGCQHLCRHCPVVPVYQGQFRIVQPEVVLEDIAALVELGAQHITFGDPDFFNGIGHALTLVKAMHQRHPQLSYDVTIKIEHLLKYARHLEALRETGCVFVTSAAESIDDRVLRLLEKGHTRQDFLSVVKLFKSAGLTLSPTFIPFTPWTTRQSYRELLQFLVDAELIDQVAPVQLAIRLLIPAGSRLLELEEVRGLIGPFDEKALSYRWSHPDPELDEFCHELLCWVHEAESDGLSRSQIFAEIQRRSDRLAGLARFREWLPPRVSRPAVPYLTEPWYC